MKGFIAFFSGIIFALGLGISGMTQPHIVRGFLDIFGQWDYRLMGVMVGAIAVHAISYKLIMKRSAPICDEKFFLPLKQGIDARLIVGAMLFGLGWGWVGICPGPGIVSLASGKDSFIYFVIAMVVGMKIFHFIERKYL